MGKKNNNGLNKNQKTYSPILPGTSEWPVVRLSRDRKAFIKEVTEEGVKKIKELCPTKALLIEELETTLYREQLRIKQNPWKVDPEDDTDFWKKVRSRLVNLSQVNGEDTPSEDNEEAILRDIISRYAEEIAGNFRPSSYKVARNLVKFGFARLLNAARIKGFGAFFRNELTLQDKIQIMGETEHIRKLAKIGTVVMVPTHFSNLDSILIGWVIHVLGLPAFIYGAGLNLFNTGILAYFMNSLGAYKVDRRKKNLLYIETLKTYSRMAIQRGAHSLFFPGGTRNRSGKIENNLKLGLLSTAVEAQRECFANPDANAPQKIFIVPVVINYHFVLEAPALINEYLERKGQERYYQETDRYSTSYKMITFLLRFFTKGSDISVSIGRGMDILGNYVDDEGNSIDKQGRVIDTRDYFMSGGEVTDNQQREAEYTRMLSEVVVKEYHRINRVFASHLVAFTAFQLYRRRFPKLDLYNFLRLPEEELVIPYEEFKKTFKKLRNHIMELKKQKKVKVAPHMKDKLNEVIELGIENVGMYHSKRPLLRDKEGNITTQDLNTLFYYHNRMDGYELEKYI